jgi:hypothetical protein
LNETGKKEIGRRKTKKSKITRRKSTDYGRKAGED